MEQFCKHLVVLATKAEAAQNRLIVVGKWQMSSESMVRIGVLFFAACALCLANSAFVALTFSADVTIIPFQEEQEAPYPFSFVFYGDSRHGGDEEDERAGNIAREIETRQIVELRPKLVIHGGDMVRTGASAADWERFRAEIAPIPKAGIPVYPVIGNHDYRGDLSIAMRHYQETFSYPGSSDRRWYSLVSADVLFIIIDSNVDFGPGSEQYGWLRDQLSQVDDYTFAIPLLHHPVFTGGHHEGSKAAQEVLHPLFVEHNEKIKLVFSCHNHSYERLVVDGITYVVSGGGGAPLYEVSQDTSDLQFAEMCYHICVVTVHSNRLELEMYTLNSDLEWDEEPHDVATISASIPVVE